MKKFVSVMFAIILIWVALSWVDIAKNNVNKNDYQPWNAFVLLFDGTSSLQ